MEAIERCADLGNELERGIHLVQPPLHRIRTLRPRKILRARTKRIAARAAEGVPVGNCKPEMFLHGFFSDFPTGIVIPEREGII